MILKKLDFKSIRLAIGTCKEWRKVINDFNIEEFVSCKFPIFHTQSYAIQNEISLIHFFFKFPVRTSGILYVGREGINCLTPDKVLTLVDIKELPNGFGSIFIHNGIYMHNTAEKCFQLDHGTLTEHSTFNQYRGADSSFVSTKTSTFIFGGCFSKDTYEYLPQNSNTWVLGRSQIPGGFQSGCAIAVKSEEEIWLIGGFDTEKRILSFNVKDHIFKELPAKLNIGRWDHKCAFIPGTKKIMVTGGRDDKRLSAPDAINGALQASTEIIDTETGKVNMARPMNCKRFNHGIGIITFQAENRLFVFGGYGRDPFNSLKIIEFYDTKTQKWRKTGKIKMNSELFLLPYSCITTNLWDIRKISK